MNKKVLSNPGILVYPQPVVMLSSGEYSKGQKNIMTLSWSGVINSEPPMVYVSIRPSRYSYNIVKERKEFVLNIPTKDLAIKADYCGNSSGIEIDKFSQLNLSADKAKVLDCPIIKESPVNIECKVKDIIPLGTHHMFLSEVVSISADEKYINSGGILNFNDILPICYSNREYHEVGKFIGKFGYSI